MRVCVCKRERESYIKWGEKDRSIDGYIEVKKKQFLFFSSKNTKATYFFQKQIYFVGGAFKNV